jgi:hypothetical protein
MTIDVLTTAPHIPMPRINPRFGDLIVGASGSHLRVRKVGRGFIEGWCVENPSVTEYCKSEDVQSILRPAPEHNVRLRCGDVVLVGDSERTVAHYDEATDTVDVRLDEGFVTNHPRAAVLLVRRPVEVGDRLLYVRPGVTGLAEEWIVTEFGSASRDTGTMIASLSIGCDGLHRWTHKNKIPIDPSGVPVRNLRGEIVGRTIERPKMRVVSTPNADPEFADERKPSPFIAEFPHKPSAVDEWAKCSSSPTQSTLNTAKELGLELRALETNEELRARITSTLEATMSSPKKSLRNLIEANIPVYAVIDEVIAKLFDFEQLARAFFATDPEVIAFVNRVAETEFPVVNPTLTTMTAQHERITRAFRTAWDRDEPKGARDRAWDRAPMFVNALAGYPPEVSAPSAIIPKRMLSTEEINQFASKLAVACGFEPWGPVLRLR